MDTDDALSSAEQNFAAAVRALREQRGWSQAELLRRLKELGIRSLNQTALSRLENGTRPVRMVEAQALSQIFVRTVASMLNPDSRESQLTRIDEDHKAARKAFVAFKDAAEGFAKSRRIVEQDLIVLDKAFGDVSDLEPASQRLLSNLRQQLPQFLTLSPEEELAAAWKRGMRKPDGQHSEAS